MSGGSQHSRPKKMLSVDVLTTQLLSLTTLHRIFTSRRGGKTGISTRSSSHAKQAQYLAYFKTLIIGAAERIKMSFGWLIFLSTELNLSCRGESLQLKISHLWTDLVVQKRFLNALCLSTYYHYNPTYSDKKPHYLSRVLIFFVGESVAPSLRQIPFTTVPTNNIE